MTIGQRFLVSALPLGQDEPATTAWFAIRFGRHEYGIFDEGPHIEKVDMLAAKLPG